MRKLLPGPLCLAAFLLLSAAPALYAQEDADSLVRRGYQRLRDNRFPEGARLDFEAALAAAPTYVDAAAGLAAALVRAGKIGKAGEALEQCRTACAGDTAKLRYLSKECWRLGFVETARKLDRATPPPEDRRLTERPHQVAAEVEGSRLENGNTWLFTSVTYAQTLRPDLTVQVRASISQRNGLNDVETGIGLFGRATRRISLSYEGALSGATDLLPAQRHRLRGAWDFGRGASAGLGGDFASYESGWVRLGRLDLEQTVRALTLRYAFASGLDNFDSALFAHVGSLTWDASERISATAGAGYGNETVEHYASSFSSQRVRTLFLSGRFRVRPALGFGAGLAAEWRNSAFFRTLAFLSASGAF